MGRPFDYTAIQYAQCFDWIRAKKAVLVACYKQGKCWITLYIACWQCFQLQTVCRVTDPVYEETSCWLTDLVLPLCYGIYQRPGQAA